MTTIVDLSSVSAQCAELSTLQVAVGFVTWLNVLKVFALVIGAVSFMVLFGRSVANLLLVFAAIPFVVYEFLGYALAVALLVGANYVEPDLVTWMIVPGGLLFAGMIPLSAYLRHTKGNKTQYALIVTVVWGAASVYYGNEIAGFGTVVSFMAFMGFSVLVMPLTYAIGFDDENAVNRAGGAGLMICGILALERWFAPGSISLEVYRLGTDVAVANPMDVFRKGMEWLGPFVFALSILISSSRWTLQSTKRGYIGAQIMAGAAFFALIMAGGMLQIDAMLNVGTGFMILFILEKPFEIPHRSITLLALTGLIVSTVVGVGVYWAQSHSEVVATWMPMLAQ